MAKMKGGLGRGLESLFGDSITEFEPVSVIAPDENKVLEEPESKPAAKAAAGKNASKKAGASAEAKGSKAASKTSEKAVEAKDNSIVYIKLSDIKPNSKQPRTVFDEEALDELGDDMEEANEARDNLADVIEATRNRGDIASGVSPRGSLALLRTAQVMALFDDRDYIVPEDIRTLAVPVLAHRIILPHGYGSTALSSDIIREILDSVPVPTETF